MTQCAKVLITTIDGFFGCSHRNTLLICILYGILTTVTVPFMPFATTASVGFSAKNPNSNYTYPHVMFAFHWEMLVPNLSFGHNG